MPFRDSIPRDVMRRLRRGVLFVSFLTLLFFVRPGGAEERKRMPDTMQAESFSSPFDVPHGHAAKTPFSPKVTPDFRGIRISAPETAKIAADGTVTIPISMTTQFSAAYLMKFDVLTHHMSVVAVNGKTGASLTSTLQEDDAAAPLPEDREGDPAELESTIFESYLTFDLARFLLFPNEAAVYHVHVTLENHQSNVVTIKIQKPGK